MFFAEYFPGKNRVLTESAVFAGAGKLLIEHRRHIHHRSYYITSSRIFPVLFFAKSDINSTITIDSIESESENPL